VIFLLYILLHIYVCVYECVCVYKCEFMNTGPGPVYKLPTLVGYSGHDPSRHRNPAYSIRARTGIKTYVIGPGPGYNIRNLTKSGIDNPPAYTIRGREAWRRKIVFKKVYLICV
jgi:hypothetical protein